jgi:lysophospholipase L1-like esterase
MRGLSRAGFLLLWLGFVFLLLEGAGYVYFETLGVQPIGGFGYPHGLYIADSQLDYRLAPGFVGQFHGAAYGTIPIRINSDGFRDDEFRRDRPGERIVVLGDSVVFGSGVREEDRFTEQLASTGFGPGRAVAVWNLGVNSYSFDHYLGIARQEFFGLEPDVVVVGFTLNDIEERDESWPARRFGTLGGGDASSLAGWLRYAERLWDRSLAGCFVREVKAKVRLALMDDSAREAYHTRWMRGVEELWATDAARSRLARAIDEFDALLRSQNRAYRVFVFPELNALMQPGEFAVARTTLHRMLDERGIAWCDAHDAFARHPGGVAGLFLPDDSVHFTPLGHRIAAAALRDCLASAAAPASRP